MARFSSRSVEKRWKLELIMIHTNTSVIVLPKLQIIATLEVLKVEGEDMVFWLIVLKVTVHIFITLAPNISRCEDSWKFLKCYIAELE